MYYILLTAKLVLSYAMMLYLICKSQFFMSLMHFIFCSKYVNQRVYQGTIGLVLHPFYMFRITDKNNCTAKDHWMDHIEQREPLLYY